MNDVYVSMIENGSITSGADYLKMCMHDVQPIVPLTENLPLDAPLPDSFAVDPSIVAEYEKAADDYTSAMQRSVQENANLERQRLQAEIDEFEREISNIRLYNARAQSIRNEIASWNPAPHGEELKEYALSSLDASFISEKHLQDLDSVLEEWRSRLRVDDRVLADAYRMRMRNHYFALKKDYLFQIKRVRKANAYMNSVLNSLTRLNKPANDTGKE